MPIKHQVGDKIKHFMFGIYTITEIFSNGEVMICGPRIRSTPFLYPSEDFEDKHTWPTYTPCKPKVRTCQ